jgi:anhydro-N-acetylmuramic acid kinase
MKSVWAVGLMTGTVLDGMVDIAAIRTDGEEIHEFGPWKLAPYPQGVRQLLSDAMSAALEWQFEGTEPAIFRKAEEALTFAQAETVNQFFLSEGLSAKEVAIVGFHGQTVLHRPPEPGKIGRTRQLGDGTLMARMIGTEVAYDFRTADMCAGGQGAPLSAGYHRALLRRIGHSASTAILNLGGVANITWWDGGDQLIACDTGPANAPLNDWTTRHSLGPMDHDGLLARQGRVDEARLASMLRHPYFGVSYPKSLDRNTFSAALAHGLGPADGAATLSAFVGAAVGSTLDRLPQRPKTLILCGGGRKNPAIVEAIRRRAKVDTVMAEVVGWRGDAIEAECFAYIAVRVSRALPISFPQTTGVGNSLTGGLVARPTNSAS